MAGAGHIGSSLSCLEILVDLCFGRMEKDDVLVLSKGHAAAALYTTLSLSERLPETELSTFYKDGTVLSAHPPCSGAIRAIPFGTSFRRFMTVSHVSLRSPRELPAQPFLIVANHNPAAENFNLGHHRNIKNDGDPLALSE